MNDNGWDAVPLSAVAADGGVFVDGDWVESKDQDPNGEIRLTQLADVGDSFFLDKSDRWINSNKFCELQCTEVLPGDILIARMPDPIARSTILPEGLGYSVITVVDVAILRAGTGWNSRYVMWAINSSSFRNDVDSRVSGSTRQRISRSALGRTKLFRPPLETQQRIADYLDRETAEIDAAVADLDKYVELLEKRRLFTVDEVLNSNEAVTSEWTEMSLKFVIRERFVGDWGGEPGTAEVDSVCVRVADFDRPTNTVNDQVPTTRSYSRAKYEAKRLQHHDILVERSGGGDKTPVGSAMLYTGGDEALCANFIEVVRLKEDQLPEYWVHILRREYMGRNTMRFVKQTTGIQNLDPQSFYDQKFPVPSLNEQHSLAEELRQRTSEIDSLIADSTRLRDLLLKRRSVLITEVVTGRKRV